MGTRNRYIFVCMAILVASLMAGAGLASASDQLPAWADRREGTSPADIGPNERFRIKLTRLHCSNANEDDFWSDGDEPYVIVAILRPDAWAGYTLTFESSRVFSGVDAHDNVETNVILMHRHVEHSVAIIAQVVEEDNTGKSAVFLAAQHSGSLAFVTALADGERDLNNLRREVAEGMRVGMLAAVDEPGDTDELIGMPAQITVTQQDFDNLRLNGSTTKEREVEGNGARYTLTLEITRTQ